MEISVYTTKNAPAYRVLLDGALVEHWISADDEAGVVVREVADVRGGMRFMREERATGSVVIEAPKATKKVT